VKMFRAARERAIECDQREGREELHGRPDAMRPASHDREQSGCPREVRDAARARCGTMRQGLQFSSRLPDSERDKLVVK